MNPIDLDRFAKCPALAERGATTGERAAAHVAAERIAASASLTLADARARLRPVRPSVGAVPPHARGPYAWAQPKESIKPITAEELLRQKVETEAWRKQAAAAADGRPRRESAEQEGYEAQQRATQAERDREWARSRVK